MDGSPKNDLSDKYERLEFGVGYSLEENGFRRALSKIEPHHVPHTAWDVLLNYIRNDIKFQVPPLYNTSGRNRISKTDVFRQFFSFWTSRILKYLDLLYTAMLCLVHDL